MSGADGAERPVTGDAGPTGPGGDNPGSAVPGPPETPPVAIAAPEPFRLPRRPARPLATHILIDGIVAAIVVGIPGFLAGIPLWALLSVGGFIGIAAAPFTRRAEIRALAKRPEASALPAAPPDRSA
ncbi:MAG: hypothetical protein JWL73_2696 [Actinomycetia bacterium]|nr:hypothetical protein [Actinomycetes bacterium]